VLCGSQLQGRLLCGSGHDNNKVAVMACHKGQQVLQNTQSTKAVREVEQRW
jgi:hypothetical protein